jgi:hypothetical protein
MQATFSLIPVNAPDRLPVFSSEFKLFFREKHPLPRSWVRRLLFETTLSSGNATAATQMAS